MKSDLKNITLLEVPLWAENVASKKLSISKKDEWWEKILKKVYNFLVPRYIGKWDYKRTHPIFSKVQQSTIRYSKYFVYDKAPKKIIRYDFLGNYNYAVTGMYVLMFTEESRSKGILTWVNEHTSGTNDAGDREAVALGEKNYRQYS